LVWIFETRVQVHGINLALRAVINADVAVKAIRYIILGPCQLDGGATLVAQVESMAAQMVV
jgi:hypothetical protein